MIILVAYSASVKIASKNQALFQAVVIGVTVFTALHSTQSFVDFVNTKKKYNFVPNGE